VKAQGSFPWSMKTLVMEENRLQTCNIFHILIHIQETPRSITRSPMTMLDGGPSSSSGSPTSSSHLLNSFGGIFAGSDYYNNFNHRSFCSTRIPTDAHDVGHSGRLYDSKVSALVCELKVPRSTSPNEALLLPHGVRPTSSLKFDERSIC